MPLSWGVLFAVLSASAYAVYIALTRKVSSQDTTATSMVYVGVVGLVMTSAAGVFFWRPMPLEDLKIIVLMVFWSLGEEPDALILDELFVAPEERLIH